MTLPTSGPLTFSMILAELGRPGPLSFNDPDARALCGVAEGIVKLSDFYGKSKYVAPPPPPPEPEPPKVSNRVLGITDSFNFSVTPHEVNATASQGDPATYSFRWIVHSTTGPVINPGSSTSVFAGFTMNTITISGTGTIVLSCEVSDSSGAPTQTTIETYTLPAPATGGDTGGGGGGGGGCVAIESYLPEGSIAGDIRMNSVMLLGDENTLEDHVGVVTYSKTKVQRGYRIQTSSGAALRCSETAPIPTMNSGFLTPEYLLAQFVPVRRVHEDGVVTVRWEQVVSIEDIGMIAVQHITVGDKCFWAGESNDAFILHHNLKNADLGDETYQQQ